MRQSSRFHRFVAIGAFVAAVVLSSVGVRAATYVVPKDEALIARSDAIVIARALHSHVQESTEGVIETVTVFAVEEVLKGDPLLQNGIRVRVPGGMVEKKKGEKRISVVPGAPRFVDGERVLLLLKQIGRDDFATTDFGLGSFAFATDDVGNRVVVRNETEIIGWDLDGSVHKEPRRDADRFLGYIRDVVNHRPMSDDYTIKANPLVGDSRSIMSTSLHPRPLSGFTVTQYTLTGGGETDQGFRWKTFPTAVNFNRGNSEPNVGNSGSDAINTAFSAWNGDTNSNVNYVLATTVSNTTGIQETPDGVNNIVFEKNLNFIGVSAFSCSMGGVVGVGGITTGNSDPTNMVNGETFFANAEVDVSMNQGVGNCLPGGGGSPTYPIGDFNSALTHEVGHTLGFRHSNQSRDGTQPCTNFPSYDCEMTTAIMKSVIPNGLAATLQPWDQRAVDALYPAPPAPTNVLATATSTTSVQVAWTAAAGAATYEVSRSSNNSTFTPVCGNPTPACPSGSPFTDSSAVANHAYIYKVRSVDAGSHKSTFSNGDLATTVIFTDDPLVATTTIVKAVHLTELRTAIDAVRTLAGLGGGTYSDLSPAGVVVKKTHIDEMRAALDPARSTLSLSPLTYTDTTITLNTTIVKAAHFQELRNGVK
jgi:hypothetical protein